jgi:predicted nucleic acid-binding protein
VKIKKLFFDANIFNDIFDETRTSHSLSKAALKLALENNITPYTSCDIVTNIYYITSKYTSSQKALDALDALKVSVEIIPFSAEELTQTIHLMRNDSDFVDMEDTIQYILALQNQCDYIITNDKKFVSKKIPAISAKKFLALMTP